MGNESTAIHDLLAGLQRKSLPDDPDDDLLFAGSRRRDDATEIDGPRRHARGTQPPPRMFEERLPPAPPPGFAPVPGAPSFAAPPIAAAQSMSHAPAQQVVVPLPRVFQNMPSAGIDPQRAPRNASTQSVRSNKRVYAIAAGLFAVVVVLLGIYVTGGDDVAPQAKVAASASSDEAPTAVERMEAKPMAAPVVEPIVEAKAAPSVEPKAAPSTEPMAEPAVDEKKQAGPTVTPIEPEPAAAAEPAAAEPVAAAAPVAEPVAAPTVPAVAEAAPATGLPRDAVAPPEVVPASTFAPKHESTLPTVTSKPVTAVPVPTIAVAKTAAPEKATPAPKATPTKVAKKSRRELARERREAKRAAKRAKQRDTVAAKSVARAEPAKTTKADKASDAKLGGNGALQISSADPREVWVDGRNSKRMTPLRVLLKPGKHKVTLFDKAKGSAKTFEVEIKPNETTKVSK